MLHLLDTLESEKVKLAIYQIKKHFITDDNQILQSLLRHNVVDKMIEMLKVYFSDTAILVSYRLTQHESLCIFMNATALDLNNRKSVIYASPDMMKIWNIVLQTGIEDIIIEMIVTIENACGNSKEVRAVIKDCELLFELLRFLESEFIEIDLAVNIMSLISKLNCPLYEEQPSEEVKQRCAKALVRLMLYLNRDDLKVECMNTIQVLSNNSPDSVKCILSDSAGVIVDLMNKFNSLIVLTLGISTCGNLALSRNPEIIDKLLAAGLLPKLDEIIKDSNRPLKKDAIWCLTSLSLGNPEQVKNIYDTKVLKKVVTFTRDKDQAVRKEAIACICAYVIAADDCTIGDMIESLRIMNILIDVLKSSAERESFTKVIFAIKILFDRDDSVSKKFRDYFFTQEGDQVINSIFENNPDIVSDTNYILKNYFKPCLEDQ
jgi:hypothetical protein